jgi:hypothetical protein
MKYQQIWDSEWGPLEKDWYLACCHCSLVHHVRVRIHKGKPEIQFTTDNRKTAALRRHAKHAKETKEI